MIRFVSYKTNKKRWICKQCENNGSNATDQAVKSSVIECLLCINNWTKFKSCVVRVRKKTQENALAVVSKSVIFKPRFSL